MPTPSPDPIKLLARLERATDQLRWFRWLEKHKADIIGLTDGQVQVYAPGPEGALGQGKTLVEAMQQIDARLEERRVEARRRQQWQSLHDETPRKNHTQAGL